ncbi:MAG TPA: hypothetical protein P5016_14990 [Verrucomicrobiales bacterium]|nr:hypothetical protein [Verrucomicrobiae bacterium]MCP5554092.1 hypothetical protein [Akkermansiaceae bacterium]HRX55819.1 hypothetical protein [Verrucomicrobiales bacterium]
MIRVSLGILVIVYLTFLLGTLAVVWFVAEFLRIGRERQRRQHFVICGLCDHIYEDVSEERLPPCPRCGALNERSRVREI